MQNLTPLHFERHSELRRDAITVWRFPDAPEEFRKLSPHGGDEDWLAFVPAELVNYAGVSLDEFPAPWLESLGVCDTSCSKLPDGSCVFIGAHA
jgi:hypothetical protein